MTTAPLLEVTDLRVRFRSRNGSTFAVNGVDFNVYSGETLGVVGESGCGKSVTNLAIMRLLPDSAEITGRILFADQDVISCPKREVRLLRGRDIAMVFQDPMTSLNPVLKIGEQIAETILAHEGIRKEAAWKRSKELLDLVGIANPDGALQSYPHQFSGGMRQRVMIALALALEPRLIIADEPTTALDVTVQAQVLELLRDLTERTGTALMLVTHDLGVVAGMTRRVNVMYAGRIVETGNTDDIFERPAHPYTVGLLGSIPRLYQATNDALHPIQGQPPDPRELNVGCPFEPRCPRRLPVCRTENPMLHSATVDHVSSATSSGDHQVACHNPQVDHSVEPGAGSRGFRKAAS